MKNKLIILSGILLFIVLFAMVWRVYSMFTFEGYFTPWYVWGISNPFEYWQKHIGLLLIENGKPYDLKLSIDENDSNTYNIYRNKKHNFEFKYPKGFFMKVDDSLDNRSTSIKIFKNEKKVKVDLCYVTAQYIWRGGSKDWIPRRRLSMENFIKKGNTPFYFVTKQGQVVHTDNNIYSDNNAQICYINKKKSQIIDFSIGGEECPHDLLVDIILTFQFVK
jgi:hypothetical protein